MSEFNVSPYKPGLGEGQEPAQEIALESQAQREIPEAVIKERAQRILTATAAKHGIAADQLSPEMAERAVTEAKRQLEREANDEGNTWKRLYDQTKAELELAKTQTRVLTAQRTAQSNRDAKPTTTAEAAMRRVGPKAWHGMNVAQQLAAIGVDARTVDIGTLEDLFSTQSDHRLAGDLMRTDPLRYRQLKEQAYVLDVYGKPRGNHRKIIR